MKRLGIIANAYKERAPDVLRRIQGKAAALRLTLCADAATAGLVPDLPVAADGAFEAVDAIMALGGDGTMLRAVRVLGGRDIPVIGVNIGSLGFLTSVAEGDLERALECLARDDVIFSRRTMAACTVRRGTTERGRYVALNDVVVSSGATSRMVTLDVTLGGDRVASYWCDGLIVSTPTGSTGHNLSAGGPILMPETPAFVISLICPHTLSSRPLVVPDASEIRIQGGGTRGRETELQLRVDGQVGEPLQPGEAVCVRAADKGVRFIHLPGYSYFGVLSQKLGWKGSNVR